MINSIRFFIRSIWVPILLLAAEPVPAEDRLRSNGDFLVKVAPTDRPQRSAAPAGGLSMEETGWKWHALGSDASGAAPGNRVAGPQRGGGAAFWIVASPAAFSLPAGGAGNRPQARAAGGVALPRPVASSNTPWDDAHDNLRIQPPPGGGMTLRAALQSAGLEIRAIEPNIVIHPIFPEDDAVPGSTTRAKPGMELGSAVLGASLRAWPSREPFDWHLDATGLREARRIVESTRGTARRVRVALLDTGYDPDHITRPRYFIETLSTRFLPDGREDSSGHGRSDKSGHGTATMAILAGNRVRIGDGAPAYIGGAPSAEVFQIRVYDQVVLLSVASLSAGLDRAIKEGADVVSISMGGVPSNAWADSVNRAYENGTAVIAASGNCLAVPVLGFLSTPSRTVYPAAFPRVLSVSGVTASLHSYRWLPFPGGLLPWNWRDIIMRGNIGPRHDMTEAVGAFTPNVLWAQFEKPNRQPHTRISRSGSGTSAATPQVAAAAALWFQMHRAEFNSEGWRSWRKVEAVYQVLFRTADSRHDRQYSSVNGQRPLGYYFGNGLLRADLALALPAPSDLKKAPRAYAGLSWLRLLLPVDASGGLRRAPALDRESQVSEEMLQLEAAQLVASSPKLQRLLGDIDPDSEQLPAPAQARLRAALAAEPGASRRLKEAIARENALVANP